jgi:hypothetical protein
MSPDINKSRHQQILADERFRPVQVEASAGKIPEPRRYRNLNGKAKAA